MAPALGLRWDSDRGRLEYPTGTRSPISESARPSNPRRVTGRSCGQVRRTQTRFRKGLGMARFSPKPFALASTE